MSTSPKNTKPHAKAPKVYTVEEVAKLLRISRGTAYEMARTQRIPSLRLGRRLLVPAAALEAFLSNPGESAPHARP